jgi:hypothetical protein
MKSLRLENTSEEICNVEAGEESFEIAPGETKTIYLPEDEEVKTSQPIAIHVLGWRKKPFL